jgi:hypothetical protein
VSESDPLSQEQRVAPSISREEIELLKVSLDHAQAWMTLHADQRLRALQFWLIAVAALTTAYVGTLRADPVLAAAIAVLGTVLSLGFQRLERRTRELVKRAEDALRPTERRLAELTGIEALQLVEASDKKGEPFTSYATVIGTLQLVAVAGFVVAAFVAQRRIG